MENRKSRGLGESSSDVLQIGFELLRRSMGDVDVGRGGPTVDWHDASLDLCPCPRASSMARGHVQEDELDRGNGVPRGMQRRCERAWPRSWCSAETIPFSIATAEAGFCELDGQRSSPRKGAHRLLGLLAMIKSRASTHSCFPVFGFLAMIKSRASTRSSSFVFLWLAAPRKLWKCLTSSDFSVGGARPPTTSGRARAGRMP